MARRGHCCCTYSILDFRRHESFDKAVPVAATRNTPCHKQILRGKGTYFPARKVCYRCRFSCSKVFKLNLRVGLTLLSGSAPSLSGRELPPILNRATKSRPPEHTHADAAHTHTHICSLVRRRNWVHLPTRNTQADFRPISGGKSGSAAWRQMAPVAM